MAESKSKFIFSKAILYIIISWLTLDCRLHPESSEYHDMTLMKLLFLYDPEACGRVYFYNHTISFERHKTYSIVVWPVKNEVAASFRTKLKVLLALHVLWLFFGALTVLIKHRAYCFYLYVMPFTLLGSSLLIIDLINVVLFITYIPSTSTENQILSTLDASQYLKRITKPIYIPHGLDSPIQDADTSWIALLFAFISFRGVIQWVANFWTVKDNFMTGFAEHRRIKVDKPKRAPRKSIIILALILP